VPKVPLGQRLILDDGLPTPDSDGPRVIRTYFECVIMYVHLI
jgi:hypothetical protein